MAGFIFFCAIAVVVWLSVKKSLSKVGNNVQVGAADLSMLPERFIVFDLETTGLKPDKHEIIEIGAIKVDRDGEEHLTFSTLVMPEGRISSKITQITGIDRAMIKADGVSREEALTLFREFVEDLPMIAFNCDFDSGFLRSSCERAGLEPFPNQMICALKLARKAWPGRRSYRLTAICQDAGVTVVSEHRALPDCERAMRVYAAAASQLGRVS